MDGTRTDTVTQVLATISDRSEVVSRLFPLVYDELRELADGYLQRERPDHTLQATALVNEAYLRLVDQQRVAWTGRAHFLAIAATAMRRILVNHAKAHGRLKRGGGRARLALNEALDHGAEPEIDLVALDEALETLAQEDPRKVEVIELRFFAGQTLEQTAVLMAVSEATVRRDWDFARAWLLRRLSEDGDE